MIVGAYETRSISALASLQIDLEAVAQDLEGDRVETQRPVPDTVAIVTLLGRSGPQLPARPFADWGFDVDHEVQRRRPHARAHPAGSTPWCPSARRSPDRRSRVPAARCARSIDRRVGEVPDLVEVDLRATAARTTAPLVARSSANSAGSARPIAASRALTISTRGDLVGQAGSRTRARTRPRSARRAARSRLRRVWRLVEREVHIWRLAVVAHVDRDARCAVGPRGICSPSRISAASASSSANTRPSSTGSISCACARTERMMSWRRSTCRMPSADVTPGVGGTTTCGIPSSRGDLNRVQRSGAAAGDEHELARIIAPLDRDQMRRRASCWRCRSARSRSPPRPPTCPSLAAELSDRALGELRVQIARPRPR